MHDLKQLRKDELVLLEGINNSRELIHFCFDGLVIKFFVGFYQGVNQLFGLFNVECAVVVGVK